MTERKNKLRVGIAGYGVVGKTRHEVANLHPHLEVVAVCDQSFKDKTSIAHGIKSFDDYRRLLEEKLDVLFVCLPNYIAPDVVIRGLDLGMHVFCEKPPGRNLDDIKRVIEVEKKYPKQKLMYGFNHRYHSSVRDAYNIIQKGDLGRVFDMHGVYGKSKIINYSSRDNWRTKRDIAGGGILLDQGIHMVDMMRLFAGSDFSDVYSFINNDFWKHDVEDNAYALMRTANGTVAMLQSSATQWRHRFKLDITLSNGAIMLSGILSSTRSYGAETMTVVYRSESDAGDPREQMIRYNEDNSWRDEVYDFVDAIIEDKPIIFGSSLEAYKTMKLVYQIYCADENWKNKYNLKLD